jgi:N-acetylneuraminic acid mutarotase
MTPHTSFNPALPLSLLALLACSDSTQPNTARSAEAAALLAAPRNSWIPRAGPPVDEFTGDYALGMAPNSAGQSIVYTFGSVSSDDGSVGGPVRAYNVATNTWTTRVSNVHVFNSNGVGKLGIKLYFSGGYSEAGGLPTFSRELWAYDYARDLMVTKARLPIFGAEGVTGVISGKLYVLPGACSGENFPSPGYCAQEQTRRFYRYDPVTNTWISRAQAPHFHRKGAAAAIDGKLYVAGGLAGFGTPVASLDVYNPNTNTWSSLASLPVAGVASGAGLHGQFFVVVQSASGPRLYAYNRLTNQWKAKAAPPFPGAVTLVAQDGNTFLFLAAGNKSALYTP